MQLFLVWKMILSARTGWGLSNTPAMRSPIKLSWRGIIRRIPIIPRGDLFVVSPVLIFNISCAASKMLLRRFLGEEDAACYVAAAGQQDRASPVSNVDIQFTRPFHFSATLSFNVWLKNCSCGEEGGYVPSALTHTRVHGRWEQWQGLFTRPMNRWVEGDGGQRWPSF